MPRNLLNRHAAAVGPLRPLAAEGPGAYDTAPPSRLREGGGGSNMYGPWPGAAYGRSGQKEVARAARRRSDPRCQTVTRKPLIDDVR